MNRLAKLFEDSNWAASLAGAKNSQAGVLKKIDDPRSENIIRTDHGQINRLFRAKFSS